MGPSRWSRRVTTTAVVLLAFIAAVVSYSHMFDLALRHGEPAWRAALFPLSVDGMMVVASMTLLRDARQGRRGGVLPWTLLIVGSVASLAANVAVAEPTAWSRVIHAWPSFALIGAYELLMRQLRATATGDRPAIVGRSPTPNSGHTTPLSGTLPSPKSPRGREEYPHLRVVDAPGRRPPVTQCRAWTWALEHRRVDGSLPSGREIAEAFSRRDRWGRLVKQRGVEGRLAA